MKKIHLLLYTFRGKHFFFHIVLIGICVTIFNLSQIIFNVASYYCQQYTDSSPENAAIRRISQLFIRYFKYTFIFVMILICAIIFISVCKKWVTDKKSYYLMTAIGYSDRKITFLYMCYWIVVVLIGWFIFTQLTLLLSIKLLPTLLNNYSIPLYKNPDSDMFWSSCISIIILLFSTIISNVSCLLIQKIIKTTH